MIAASVIKWTKPRECFLFCSCYILFSSTIHQNFTKEKSWSWQYLDITSLLTGWESFHRRNNSFREHNTLFSAHMQPCSLYTHITAHAEYRWPLWDDDIIISYQQFYFCLHLSFSFDDWEDVSKTVLYHISTETPRSLFKRRCVVFLTLLSVQNRPCPHSNKQ